MRGSNLKLSDQDWHIIKLVYDADITRINHQLQYIMTIRGWAITVFTGVITALVIYRIPVVSIAGIVALLVFCYSECRYDADRIIHLQRIGDIERTLKTISSINIEVLPPDGECSYDWKKAVSLALRRPTRRYTYSLLVILLAIFGVVMQLCISLGLGWW